MRVRGETIWLFCVQPKSMKGRRIIRPIATHGALWVAWTCGGRMRVTRSSPFRVFRLEGYVKALEKSTNLDNDLLADPSSSLLLSRSMPPSLIAFILIFLAGVLLRSLKLLNKSHAERLASMVFSISLPRSEERRVGKECRTR